MKKLLPLIVLVITSFVCNAQTWDSVGGWHKGAVRSMTIYDSNLIAADGSIYQLNGNSWSPLGKIQQGKNYNVGAIAVTVYNGNLIAAGAFDSADGIGVNNIAQWNGTSWSALGTGIILDGSPYYPRSINALCVYNGNLIAAGQFDSAGGIAAKSIAQWNGTSWSALGSGVDSIVLALAVYKNNLMIGGTFDSVNGGQAVGLAQWDGSTLSGLALGNKIQALLVYNSTLLATSQGYNSIKTWNGSTAGTFGKAVGGMQNIEALAVYNGNLVAGGMINLPGKDENPITNVLEWNGTDWDTLGYVLYGGPADIGLETFIVYNGVLIAGGDLIPSSHYGFGLAQLGSSPASINQLTTNPEQVKVYPNPSNGIFSIEEQEARDKEQVKVYNMFGENIYNTQFNTTTTQIDLNGRPAGVYLYRVVNENGEAVASGKLVIE